MYQLTNEERISMGIKPVEDTWELVKLIPSPYDHYESYAYLDGDHVYKLIQVYDDWYQEMTLNETLSEDRVFLLPKTEKGKPQKFTAANLAKRPPLGMVISYINGNITLYNETTQQCYYTNAHTEYCSKSIGEFAEWAKKWQAATDERRLAEIQSFANRARVHVKYKEGDFFRFRIDRDLWGYGRLLLNYDKMRKEKQPFWNIFFGKPLVVAVYHIITEDPHVSIDELSKLKMLPSAVIMDNVFFYGEYEVIGNRPLRPEEENYPIHYGESRSALTRGVIYLQHGRAFRMLPDEKLVCEQGFAFAATSWRVHQVTVDILRACIKENSNAPYWRMIPRGFERGDLRSPRFAKEREAVFAQMGLSEDEIKFKN